MRFFGRKKNQDEAEEYRVDISDEYEEDVVPVPPQYEDKKIVNAERIILKPQSTQGSMIDERYFNDYWDHTCLEKGSIVEVSVAPENQFFEVYNIIPDGEVGAVRRETVFIIWQE